MLMTRRLYRSRTDTMLGGVAAGLASYLNTDPALVRVAWAALVVITSGAALLAYIVAWVVVPEEPLAASVESTNTRRGEPVTDPVTGEVIAPVATPDPAPASRTSDGRAGVVVGSGLVLIGVWFLLREYLPEIDWSLIWPLVIVGIGAAILVTSMRRRTD
jgi:phage shock protein PspC (stress-responsive transcriptional regulator)